MSVESTTENGSDLALRHKEYRGMIIGLVIAILTAMTGIIFGYLNSRASDETIRNNTDQYKQSSHNDYYWNVVQGLDSDSAAVQINSMRLLNLFVQDVSNYDDGGLAAQRLGASQALITLAAFIRNESGEISNGLQPFSKDIPMIVEPAMKEIRDLSENWHLGSHGFDINEADLHGVQLPGFSPLGDLGAPASDFRRANLEDMNLIGGDFNSAFFTCANLGGSDFGAADLTFADLSGADLRGADLSLVSGLDAAQLTGVWIDEETKLPDGVREKITARKILPWQETASKRKCADIITRMTGMLAAQGYSENLSCPRSKAQWDADQVLQSRVKAQKVPATVDNVVAVCTARIKG